MTSQPTNLTAKDVRVAFLSVQQALRIIQGMPPALLRCTCFPLVDEPGMYAGIDHALDLLEADLARVRVGLQNHRAGASAGKGCV